MRRQVFFASAKIAVPEQATALNTVTTQVQNDKNDLLWRLTMLATSRYRDDCDKEMF